MAGLVRKLAQRLDLAMKATPGLQPNATRSNALRSAKTLLATLQGRFSSSLSSKTTRTLTAQLYTSATELKRALTDVGSECMGAHAERRARISRAANTVLRIDLNGGAAPSPAGWLRVGPQTLYDPRKATAGWAVSSDGKLPAVYPGPTQSAMHQGKGYDTSVHCPFASLDTVLCSYLFYNHSKRAQNSQ